MMRTFCPVAILPEKTRPKAKKRPRSEEGTIFEMYIMRGAPSDVSHVRIALAAASSSGPS